MTRSVRPLLRRILPAGLRLRIAVARRGWRDERAQTHFAHERGDAAWFPCTVTSYTRPFIDYPGQERMGTAKRHNQALLASQLDGVIIAPGETFSVWALAPRPTAARGYAAAAALKDRKLTAETGGAICLLSTVLYNVALLGAMRIVERHAHSVDSYGERRYFELGRDASIEYGYLDLRFSNPHAYAVLLRVTVDACAVSASLRAAAPADFSVELCVSRPQVLEPPVRLRLDPYVPPGMERLLSEGLAGRRVRTRRLTRFTNGGLVDEDLGETLHHPVPAVVAVSPP